MLGLVIVMWDLLHTPHFTEARLGRRGQAQIVKFEQDGVMIRTHAIIQDDHFGYMGEKALGYHNIVDGCPRALAISMFDCSSGSASAGRCAIQGVEIEAFCMGQQ